MLTLKSCMLTLQSEFMLHPIQDGKPVDIVFWDNMFLRRARFLIILNFLFCKKKKNVLKFLYWGSDVLKFWLKWGLAMFLRCSYFFPNLSLDVLIDLVLNQKNACMFCIYIIFSHRYLLRARVLLTPGRLFMMSMPSKTVTLQDIIITWHSHWLWSDRRTETAWYRTLHYD